MAKLRKIIHDADPAITEWKWNNAVFSLQRTGGSGGRFKGDVKMNFFQGWSLPDGHKLFNAGLDAKKTRVTALHETDKINGPALRDLIRTAAAHDRMAPKG